MIAHAPLAALGVAVVLILSPSPTQAAPEAPPPHRSTTSRAATHGDPLEAFQSNGRDGTGPGAPATVPPAPCKGDGSSGQRVHVMYGYPADRASRFNDQKKTITDAIARVDYYLNHSAPPGVGTQHVRWLCRSQRIAVTPVKMVAIGTDNQFTLDDMVTSLQEQVKRGLGPINYADPTRIHLVFMDRAKVFTDEGQEVGGQALTVDDDQPSPDLNKNNLEPGYAIVTGFNPAIALHELGHSLGAVQNTAPHASGNSHCFQKADVMCYKDNGSYFQQGGVISFDCPESPIKRFDCGNDDYYNPAPAPGTYLDTHWNTSRSGWLTRVRKARRG